MSKLWTDDEWQRVEALHVAGLSIAHIAREVGRSSMAVAAKLDYMRWNPERVERERARRRRNYRRRGPQIAGVPPRKDPHQAEMERFVPPEVLAAQQVRLAAYDKRAWDLNGEFFGCPPPGHSALDRRNQEPPESQREGSRFERHHGYASVIAARCGWDWKDGTARDKRRRAERVVS